MITYETGALKKTTSGGRVLVQVQIPADERTGRIFLIFKSPLSLPKRLMTARLKSRPTKVALIIGMSLEARGIEFEQTPRIYQ
ncbi:hypothetical protein CDAR_478501 [Caerostris darwini]|uniref:Uncharacterized protein n=1 Tax=Caerostris darwini TaxID=1538125 RepID=A0AAV4QS69_9ARAC|nr:hypothetical protein CDAR_478501 [Caerostris darwini]